MTKLTLLLLEMVCALNIVFLLATTFPLLFILDVVGQGRKDEGGLYFWI